MPHRRPAVAALALTLSLGTAAAATADDPHGLRAQYFDAIDLSGDAALTRVDPAVSFDWGLDEPVPGVGDTFSARWTGTLTAPTTGRYTFRTRADDGVRLWIDGKLVIDDWRMHSVSERSGEIHLEAGKGVDLKLEYYDGGRLAVAELLWHPPGGSPEVVPAEALRPAIDPPVVAPDEQSPAPAIEKTMIAPALTTVRPDTTATTTEAVPPPPAPLLPPPTTPVAGETFNAAPESGQVLVRRPGDGALIALEQDASLPVGTRLDARNGAVELQTAPAAGFRGATQHARFSGATFKVGQPRKGGRVVTIDMQHGDFESCAGTAAARSKSRSKSRTTARASRSSRSSRRSSKRVRAIFGSGKGRFRTKGRHAAATVRGTVWSVEDRCDATVTSVREGAVGVENLVTGREVVVRAGESFTARPKR